MCDRCEVCVYNDMECGRKDSNVEVVKYVH